MAEITQGQLLDLLAIHINRTYGSQSRFAAEMGVSAPYVSQVLSGKKAVPAAWLDLVGARIELRVTVASEMAEWINRMDEIVGVRRG